MLLSMFVEVANVNISIRIFSFGSARLTGVYVSKINVFCRLTFFQAIFSVNGIIRISLEKSVLSHRLLNLIFFCHVCEAL